MTLLNNLKVGDIVTFRSSGKAEVSEVENRGDACYIGFDGGTLRFAFLMNGNHYLFNNTSHSPFDIVEVESPFRWEDAKPGQAFDYVEGTTVKTVWYVGPDFADPAHAVVAEDHSCYAFNFFEKASLTRNPEEDIPYEQ